MVLKKIIVCLLGYQSFLAAMEKPEDLLRLSQEKPDTEPKVICGAFHDGRFSPDGSKILSQSMLCVNETQKSNYQIKLESAKDIVGEFGQKKGRWSPRGTYIYSKGKSLSHFFEDHQRFFVWNAVTGQMLCSILGIVGTDRAKFTQDEKYFLVKGIGRELEVYDILARSLKKRLGPEKNLEHKISPQPPQGQFIANYEHPNTRLYDPVDFHEIAKIAGKLKCFSQDGKMMAIEQDDGAIVCDCNSLENLRRINTASHSFLFNRDATRILCAGYFYNEIYDLASSAKLHESKCSMTESEIKSFISLDLSKEVSLRNSDRGTELVIRDTDGTQLHALYLDAEVTDARFDSQSKYVVLGCFDELKAIISLKTGEIVYRFKEKESDYFGFWQHTRKRLPLFSSDGKFLHVFKDKYGNRWANILKLAE